jgi:hypothetical protein
MTLATVRSRLTVIRHIFENRRWAAPIQEQIDEVNAIFEMLSNAGKTRTQNLSH